MGALWSRGEVEANLDELEVPVAELAPEELVDGGGGFVEAIVPERAVDFRGDRGEARVDPAGFERDVFVRGLLIQIDPVAEVLASLHLHEQEARGVPDLVGEGAIAVGAVFREGDVGAGRGHAGEREAHGIGAEAFDDVDGVDDIALGLRHLLAVASRTSAWM